MYTLLNRTTCGRVVRDDLDVGKARHLAPHAGLVGPCLQQEVRVCEVERLELRVLQLAAVPNIRVRCITAKTVRDETKVPQYVTAQLFGGHEGPFGAASTN